MGDTQALPGLGPFPAGSDDRAGASGSGTAPVDALPGDALNGSEEAPERGAGDGAVEDGAADESAASDGAGAAGEKPGKRRRHFWRDLLVLGVVAVVLALTIKTFVVQAFYIPSGSMENTLEIGDRVLINKVIYHLRPIHRGDIVVFDGTGSWNSNAPQGGSNIFTRTLSEFEGLAGVSHDPIYIKRVIGLPGDHVVCCNAKGQVTVNGVPLSESSYLYPGNVPSAQPFNITVPAGQLWVMGDHRRISYDSRDHIGDPGGGTIPESAVLGRAFVIIWPLSRLNVLNIPATFEQPKLNASTATAALDIGSPVAPASSPVPLALGFAGALPITWIERRLRRRLKSRRGRSRRTKGNT